MGQPEAFAAIQESPVFDPERPSGLRLGCARTCRSGPDLQPEADLLVIVEDRRLAPICPSGLRELLRQTRPSNCNRQTEAAASGDSKTLSGALGQEAEQGLSWPNSIRRDSVPV